MASYHPLFVNGAKGESFKDYSKKDDYSIEGHSGIDIKICPKSVYATIEPSGDDYLCQDW